MPILPLDTHCACATIYVDVHGAPRLWRHVFGLHHCRLPLDYALFSPLSITVPHFPRHGETPYPPRYQQAGETSWRCTVVYQLMLPRELIVCHSAAGMLSLGAIRRQISESPAQLLVAAGILWT
jgi:hypothetical protein